MDLSVFMSPAGIVLKELKGDGFWAYYYVEHLGGVVTFVETLMANPIRRFGRAQEGWDLASKNVHIACTEAHRLHQDFALMDDARNLNTQTVSPGTALSIPSDIPPTGLRFSDEILSTGIARVNHPKRPEPYGGFDGHGIKRACLGTATEGIMSDAVRAGMAQIHHNALLQERQEQDRRAREHGMALERERAYQEEIRILREQVRNSTGAKPLTSRLLSGMGLNWGQQPAAATHVVAMPQAQPPPRGGLPAVGVQGGQTQISSSSSQQSKGAGAQAPSICRRVCVRACFGMVMLFVFVVLFCLIIRNNPDVVVPVAGNSTFFNATNKCSVPDDLGNITCTDPFN
jgi:hypothetical protein